VSIERKHKRREERKFRRIVVRYGHKQLEHKATAQQISTGGLFLATNGNVYVNGSPIVVEITGPSEIWLVAGIVRHAYKVHPSMMHAVRPGMGVELTNVPDACRAYLAGL
jgi:hypothetical protein